MKTAILLACLAIALASCSSNENSSNQNQDVSTQTPSTEVRSETKTKKGKVTNVDYEKRKITLEVEGKPVVVSAGEDVVNLNQIKKGDLVVSTYKEALVYSIDKNASASPLSTNTESWAAQPGETPKVETATNYTATAIVKNIDTAAPSITLQNAAGEKQTFKVAKPERLKDINVGDAIIITYTKGVLNKIEKQNSAERIPASK
jgi:ABC-type Fe3+-hydroxamate transport system substrate-binding protein